MLSNIMTQAVLLLGAQAATMPPAPEEMARRIADIPRCVAQDASQARRVSGTQVMSQADRILVAMRHAEALFPHIRCQQRIAE